MIVEIGIQVRRQSLYCEQPPFFQSGARKNSPNACRSITRRPKHGLAGHAFTMSAFQLVEFIVRPAARVFARIVELGAGRREPRLATSTVDESDGGLRRGFTPQMPV